VRGEHGGVLALGGQRGHVNGSAGGQRLLLEQLRVGVGLLLLLLQLRLLRLLLLLQGRACVARHLVVRVLLRQLRLPHLQQLPLQLR